MSRPRKSPPHKLYGTMYLYLDALGPLTPQRAWRTLQSDPDALRDRRATQLRAVRKALTELVGDNNAARCPGKVERYELVRHAT